MVHEGRTIGILGCLVVGADGGERLSRRLGSLIEIAAHGAPLLAPQLRDRERLEAARGALQASIEAERFHPVFQPIVRLRDRCVVGYEALTRFDDGVPPDVRFAEAAELGSGLALEAATLQAAVSVGSGLPAATWLSLNASGAFVLSGRLKRILGGVDRPVVIELTEHVAVDDYASLRSAMESLGPGVSLAVDDAGAGFSGLRHVVELRPRVVKLDLGIVRGVDGDPARQSLVAGMVHYTRTTNSHLVAEGVETQAEADALARLGVELAQGYLFARPARLEDLVEDGCAA
jgi:EAL domain-containing protein (putative c-di-GMP-specific phosphodiesterase class I)